MDLRDIIIRGSSGGGVAELPDNLVYINENGKEVILVNKRGDPVTPHVSASAISLSSGSDVETTLSEIGTIVESQYYTNTYYFNYYLRPIESEDAMEVHISVFRKDLNDQNPPESMTVHYAIFDYESNGLVSGPTENFTGYTTYSFPRREKPIIVGFSIYNSLGEYILSFNDIIIPALS